MPSPAPQFLHSTSQTSPGGNFFAARLSRRGTIMPNPHRGEIEALLDGTPFNLVLTLGALAELEQAFGHDDMLSLAERFQTGRISALDAQRIIGAGLRGAGHEILDEAVGRMRTEDG